MEQTFEECAAEDPLSLTHRAPLGKATLDMSDGLYALSSSGFMAGTAALGYAVAEPTKPLVQRSAQDLFRSRHFKAATRKDWNNWLWQISNRIRDYDTLASILDLTATEKAALRWQSGALPFAITPYYASLLDPANPGHPLRRCVVPSPVEHETAPGEAADPLGEDGHSPVPGLVHRYPDRVLFLATTSCSTYCRYCTRSRLVGGHRTESSMSRWEPALAYIAAHPEIRDVIVSGGDPLIMADEAIDHLLGRIRRIPHVEMIRVGTKTPAVLPQRITRSLVKVLKKHHPLFASLHFAHPAELTPETGRACEMLADAGIPLGSQTVLLKGVNDNVPALKALFTGLLRHRVRPYYLYQCDPISGSSHFRTSVDKGLELISSLRGHISGYAVPTFVIDAPGGGGKVPIYPQTMMGRDEEGLTLRNYEGRTFHYPDHDGQGARQ